MYTANACQHVSRYMHLADVFNSKYAHSVTRIALKFVRRLEIKYFLFHIVKFNRVRKALCSIFKLGEEILKVAESTTVK